MSTIPTTLDGILDRRVILEQPATGYRVAIDTVLVAAAVPAISGDRVLDMGCGVGGAMLSLACRVGGVRGVGIDIQSDLVDLCRHNIARNSFATGFEALVGDVTKLPTELTGTFDHVVMNPPYHEERRHDASDDDIKRKANIEKEGEFPYWIGSAGAALKPSGTLTLIHRSDRLKDIMSSLEVVFGQIDVLPLLPKNGTEAKRIILRARKGGVFFVSQSQPLTLHKPEGGYTAETEAILRHGEALGLTR